jgi:hypothetical protein
MRRQFFSLQNRRLTTFQLMSGPDGGGIGCASGGGGDGRSRFGLATVRERDNDDDIGDVSGRESWRSTREFSMMPLWTTASLGDA